MVVVIAVNFPVHFAISQHSHVPVIELLHFGDQISRLSLFNFHFYFLREVILEVE